MKKISFIILTFILILLGGCSNKEQVSSLENQVNELQETIKLLQEWQDNYIDNDTIYNDTEIRGLISNLQNWQEDHISYDDSEVRELLSQLQAWQSNFVDNDTIYDDTNLWNAIEKIEKYLQFNALPLTYSSEDRIDSCSNYTEDITIKNGKYMLICYFNDSNNLTSENYVEFYDSGEIFIQYFSRWDNYSNCYVDDVYIWYENNVKFISAKMTYALSGEYTGNSLSIYDIYGQPIFSEYDSQELYDVGVWEYSILKYNEFSPTK